MAELDNLRDELSKIDQELLQLFLRRMEIVAGVAEHKVKTQGPVYVPEQEVRVIRKTRAETPPELGLYATMLVRTLMRLSRERQYELLLAMDLKKAEDYTLCPDFSMTLGQIKTLAIVEGIQPAVTQMALDLYPGASIVPVKDARIACCQVAEGLMDLAVLPLKVEVLLLLEKHALLIQACLSLTGERYMVVGPNLVRHLAGGQMSLLVHGRKKAPGETLCEDSLPLVVNILSDLGLPIIHIQSLDSETLYLEFLVNSALDEAWRALYQIEQEAGGMYLLGYYR